MNLIQFDYNPDRFLIGQNFYKVYVKKYMLEKI